jgi:fumarate reductase flavoprotein subunit
MNEYEADLIIVGAGLAGLSCAIRVAELAPWATIALLDDSPTGGNTARSIGSISVAGSLWQVRAGYTDSPDDHFRDLLDMVRFANTVSPDLTRYLDLLRRMCVDGPAVIDWLVERGIRFHGPSWEAPHGKPRMLNVLPDGRALIDVLGAIVDSTSGLFRGGGSRVTSIVRHDGSFIAATTNESWCSSRIVVASGDQAGTFARIVPPVAESDSGSLLRAIRDEFGASLHPPALRAQLRTEMAGAPRISPTGALLARGRLRWTNRGGSFAGSDALAQETLLEHNAKHHGEELFLDVTGDIAMREQVATFPGIGWATISDLEDVGLAIRSGTGWAIGPLRIVQTTADGGLDVDDHMRVLDAHRKPIEGLYAAGGAALGGMRLSGHGHHLLWAATSGYTAAANIVAPPSSGVQQ